MITVINLSLLFINFMMLGTLWGARIQPTPLWISLYAAFYWLLIWGSHYYTGKLAMKGFNKWKPKDDDKPPVLNALWDWVEGRLNDRA